VVSIYTNTLDSEEEEEEEEKGKGSFRKRFAYIVRRQLHPLLKVRQNRHPLDRRHDIGSRHGKQVVVIFSSP
jgi:hypothetical protein